MPGFEAPNYTQVPNDYFDLVMEMTTAENRLLAVLLRSTFGFHRDEIKMSIRELARLTKMSPQSVVDGAKRLEGRQLIERTVSETGTTNWRVLVNSDTGLYQKIVKTVPDRQEKNSLPHIEKEKKENKAAGAAKPDLVDGMLKYQKPTETLIHAIHEAFPFNVNWNTKFARQWLEWAHGEKITPEQIRQAARTWREDKKFNWSHPTLQKIFENWPALMGRQIEAVSDDEKVIWQREVHYQGED